MPKIQWSDPILPCFPPNLPQKARPGRSSRRDRRACEGNFWKFPEARCPQIQELTHHFQHVSHSRKWGTKPSQRHSPRTWGKSYALCPWEGRIGLQGHNSWPPNEGLKPSLRVQPTSGTNKIQPPQHLPLYRLLWLDEMLHLELGPSKNGAEGGEMN